MTEPGHVGELIVVTGPPGAGKTMVARSLATTFDASALVAGDDPSMRTAELCRAC